MVLCVLSVDLSGVAKFEKLDFSVAKKKKKRKKEEKIG